MAYTNQIDFILSLNPPLSYAAPSETRHAAAGHYQKLTQMLTSSLAALSAHALFAASGTVRSLRLPALLLQGRSTGHVHAGRKNWTCHLVHATSEGRDLPSTWSGGCFEETLMTQRLVWQQMALVHVDGHSSTFECSSNELPIRACRCAIA